MGPGIEENWVMVCIMTQKLTYFVHVKHLNSLDRTVMDSVVPGRRDGVDQHGDRHRTLNTSWA